MIPAVIERCAGIDVGKKFLAVRRKFGTVRRELEELRKWLQSEGCAPGHGRRYPGAASNIPPTPNPCL
jgi:hypothetical protein